MDRDLLERVVAYLQTHDLLVVTAESCTAGMVASTLAMPPGCGSWLDAAYVTYSEEAKIACLQLDQTVIDTYGLTSEPVARGMALGALKANPRANLALSTTGVVGPSAGDGRQPVGTVCFGWAFKDTEGAPRVFSQTERFSGERNQIRDAATLYALEQIAPLHRTALQA